MGILEAPSLHTQSVPGRECPVKDRLTGMPYFAARSRSQHTSVPFRGLTVLSSS